MLCTKYWKLVPFVSRTCFKKIKWKGVAALAVVSRASQTSASGFQLLGPVSVGLVEEGGREMKVRVPNQTILQPFFFFFNTATNFGSGCWRTQATTYLLLSSSTEPVAGCPGCLCTLWSSVEHLGLQHSTRSADLQEQLFMDLFCSPWKSSLSCASNF